MLRLPLLVILCGVSFVAPIKKIRKVVHPGCNGKEQRCAPHVSLAADNSSGVMQQETSYRWSKYGEEKLMTLMQNFERKHHVVRHLHLAVAIFLIVFTLVITARQWRKRSATPEYLRCAIMALRSSIGALVMLLAASSAWIAKRSPTLAFILAFQGLPTYILLAVHTRYGRYLAGAWHALLGSLLPLVWLWAINFFMLGGASKAVELHPHDAHQWLQIGYAPMRAALLLLVFVYLIAVASIDQNAKFYGLMMYAGMAPAFMNPDLDPECLRGVIYYVNEKGSLSMAWNIYSSGQFMVVIGVFVGGLCVIPFPQIKIFTNMFGAEDDRSNLAQAKVELAALARKIGGSLTNLMSCFREDETSFELDAMSKVVYGLNAQLKEVEYHLSYACWESWTRSRRKRANDIKIIVNMFKELRWILISIISCIRSRSSGDAARVSIIAVSPCFEEYLEHSSEVIGNLVQHVGIEGSERSSLITRINSSLALARGSLDQAEERLHELTQEESSSEAFGNIAMVMVFVDCLRKWHVILHRYTNSDAEDLVVASTSKSWRKVLQKHGKALKITVGFALVLTWSARVARYNSRCVLAYIMCSFGKGIGSKVREVLYRFLGITSGTILAGIPNVLFVENQKLVGHHAMTLYILWSLFIWIVLMYCILRENAYSGSAVLCLVWAGASLVNDLQITNGVIPAPDERGTFYYTSINELVGMLTVLVVEVIFVWLSGTGTAHSAVRAVSKVLDEVRNVLQCMIHGKAPDAARLLATIETARAWNAELEGVDRLWSLPWKYEFVKDLLDQCSSIYVVASSMHGAAFKLQEDTARKVVQELVPPKLPSKIQDLTEAVLALLQQQVPQQKDVWEVLAQKNVDHRKFCKCSIQGPNIAEAIGKEDSFPDMRNTRSFLSSGKMAHYLKDEADYSAVAPIMHGLHCIRGAIRNIEVLLQMQIFLSFGRWNIGGTLDSLRTLDFHQSVSEPMDKP